MSPHLRYLLPLLLLLAACRHDPVTKDSGIDASLRARIDSLNRQVIDGFYQQKPYQVLSLCSKELAVKAENDLMSLIVTVGRRLDPGKFRIKNQFLVRNKEEGMTNTVGTGATGDHDYSLTLQSVNKESLVTVGYFADSVQSLLLLTVYGKYGEDWKLNILRIGTLEMMRQDAIGWYQKARQYFDKGQLADAANALSICSAVLQPVSEFWHYAGEKDISAFGEELKSAAKKQLRFPMTAAAMPSAPQIFQVSPEITGSGVLPMVLYATSLGMADTTVLSQECTVLHSHIGELFKGLDANNKWILYRVYEKIPTGRDTVKNYGFVRPGKES